MENLDIVTIITDLVLSGVILWLTDRNNKRWDEQIKVKDNRIAALEQMLSDQHAQHKKDLRKWGNIEDATNPRRPGSKSFVPNLTEDERLAAQRRMSE